MFENCSTIKRFFLEIIRFLLYVTFIQTQSFSLSKKKKNPIMLTIVHYQKLQIKLQEN